MAAAIAITALVSLIACRALMPAAPLDVPDLARKVHGAPTPTSGGVGIAFGFAVGLMALSTGFSQWREAISAQGASLLAAASAFCYAFLLLGSWDDARPIGPRLKFGAFALLALGGAWAVGAVSEVPIAQGIVMLLPPWLALAGSALWVFTLVNTVNFMDGSNGLAMGSIVIGMTTLAAMAFFGGSPAGVALCVCAVGALLGFLYWNFPRARLFAGDSGALFAGAVAALGALLVIHRIHLTPFAPPILFFPLLADVLLTLAWRLGRRHSLLEGHLEHHYQVLRRAGMSHMQVAAIYWLAMAVCGVIAFVVAQRPDSSWPWIALAALALVSLVITYFVRRFAIRRGLAQ